MALSPSRLTLRPLLAGAAVLSCVAALTACGGDGGGDEAAQSPEDAAVAFASCMRKHGVDMPDPVGGRIQLKATPATAPKLDDAQRACQKHLRPPDEDRDPKLEAERFDQMLKFAACMRREGIDVKDPQRRGGGVVIARSTNGPNPGSAAFQRAQRTCDKLMPRPPGASDTSHGAPGSATPAQPVAPSGSARSGEGAP